MSVETDAPTVSVDTELIPRFEERDWRHRWQRLQAQEAELSKVRIEEFSSASIHAARHELHSFYIHTYHLKDALKSVAAALGINPDDIEDAVSASPALALAADLTNLDKHQTLNRPPRSGHTPKTIGVSGISAPGGWRLRLMIEHGSKHIDGIYLAADIIKEWRDVLTKFRVI